MSDDLEHTARQVTREEAKSFDKNIEVDPREDRVRTFRTTSFSRMRTVWTPAEGSQITRLHELADQEVLKLFPDAYVILNDLYSLVRQPRRDDNGWLIRDQHGFPVWEKSESGAYIEDYSKLTSRDREDFLFRITTNLVRWQQFSVSLWGDAMFAKGIYEEVFAEGFLDNDGTTKSRLTVDDRTQRARLAANEDRYFAIFRTLISRRAEKLVDGFVLLSQRLKDATY